MKCARDARPRVSELRKLYLALLRVKRDLGIIIFIRAKLVFSREGRDSRVIICFKARFGDAVTMLTTATFVFYYTALVPRKILFLTCILQILPFLFFVFSRKREKACFSQDYYIGTSVSFFFRIVNRSAK